jgi:glycine cleavage system H lipoate-binding protein
VRVGLDDFSARLFGPQDQISLPDLGQQVARGAAEVTLLRQGLTASLQSPVSGVVVAVNPELYRRPEAAHRDPFGEGWLFLVEPSKLQSDLHKLRFGGAARNWLDEEAGRLAALVAGEDELPLAATGGQALEDIFGSLPGLDWGRLAREFLLN